MSSFTWSTMIFQHGTGHGSLFSWWSHWPHCQDRSAQVKVTSDQKIKFGVCAGSAMSWMDGTDTTMVRNQWHEVAVSYDGETGYAQAFVDGVLYSRNIGLLAQRLTTGPVVMGSRYYHSKITSIKYMYGKIACMRLWNIARDLSTMKMDTPFCKII